MDGRRAWKPWIKEEHSEHGQGFDQNDGSGGRRRDAAAVGCLRRKRRRGQDHDQLPELGQRADHEAVHRRIRKRESRHQSRLRLRAADQRIHPDPADPPRRQPGSGRVRDHLGKQERSHRQRLCLGHDRQVLRQELSQANKDFLSRDGKLYGQSISSWAAGIAYNKDLLGQVGYDSVPATWDEFLDLCGKLKNKGITPYIESLGDGNDRIPDSFMGAVYAKDGVDVTTLADKTPSTPGANEKDCVKAWMKVYEKGYASRDNVGVSGDDAKTQFANGQVAMYTTGVWDFSAFEGASFDWGFARIPALDKNHEQYSQGSPSPGLTIYSKLKGDKLKAAEKFLDFMVSDWALKQRSKNGDAITVEGFDSDVAKQYKEIYDENVKTGKYFLYTNFYKKPDVLSSANTAEIQQLVQGSISVDQWAKNIDDKMAAAQ